jgi:phage FluMu protein gp41
MFIQEHNCKTGEITLRELTAKEIADREKIAEKEQTEKAAQAAAKAAAQAKLAALGLTVEDLTALGL